MSFNCIVICAPKVRPESVGRLEVDLTDSLGGFHQKTITFDPGAPEGCDTMFGALPAGPVSIVVRPFERGTGQHLGTLHGDGIVGGEDGDTSSRLVALRTAGAVA